ncbi:MAG: sigma-54-dependent Fis family transcriptional regulator [Bacteroidetes bacterium]|nr:MAG: sigma-54-dependent Fis family transcriptional regulator [Bacteroidota bacterium]
MDRAALQERFGIIGQSPALLRELDRARQVAPTDITVLIEGESGVGKELFAQAIHELSPRRHKPLVVVNCGAIPEGLIESELFGNEKGAYTGAVERRSGYFEQADGGTIFLDEIGEMPLAAQVRLLRVLETGTFSRVGSSTLLKTDVRVIAATNKDLAREVEAGRFREDLYYRLSTVILRIPPLRERGEDILLIFDYFLHRFAQKYNSSHKRLSEDARELLLRYRWPGNVRELRNVAEQAVVLHRGDVLTAEDLRAYLRGVSAAGVQAGLVPVSRSNARDDETRERELIYRALLELRLEIREMKDQLADLVARLGTALPHGIVGRNDEGDLVIVRKASPENYAAYIEDVAYEIEGEADRRLVPVTSPRSADKEREDERDDEKPLPTLEDAERQLIAEALRRFDGNRRQTARALGISERTLYRKLKEIEADV